MSRRYKYFTFRDWVERETISFSLKGNKFEYTIHQTDHGYFLSCCDRTNDSIFVELGIDKVPFCKKYATRDKVNKDGDWPNEKNLDDLKDVCWALEKEIDKYLGVKPRDDSSKSVSINIRKSKQVKLNFKL